MDHLRRWLESGVPLSVHTSNGWYGQIERMERFKKRSIEADNVDDSLDFSFAFFQSCYHLREWIPTFESIDKAEWSKKWKKFINNNDCIRYCRDLCNVSKHMTIDVDKASITANVIITREYEEDESENGKFLGWTLHIDNKEMDFFKLMEDCTEAWKKFIKEDLFESLEISKYLEKE
ncbi:MAG: hypothetical protein KKF98_13885 [Bacteroidetes bacterium]|nr:hypothetical protein [Bacteroidota bacterium]